MNHDPEKTRNQKTAIAPMLSVRNGVRAIEFYKAAFGAVEVHRVGGTDEDPSVVAQLTVGDASLWVADESPEHQSLSPETVGGGTVKLLLIEPRGVRNAPPGRAEYSPDALSHVRDTLPPAGNCRRCRYGLPMTSPCPWSWTISSG
jgi:catechol 2,3-dioxygenase-like lactoylglutathione lyase family enzyme